jgi:hypothetical protein
MTTTEPTEYRIEQGMQNPRNPAEMGARTLEQAIIASTAVQNRSHR